MDIKKVRVHQRIGQTRAAFRKNVLISFSSHRALMRTILLWNVEPINCWFSVNLNNSLILCSFFSILLLWVFCLMFSIDKSQTHFGTVRHNKTFFPIQGTIYSFFSLLLFLFQRLFRMIDGLNFKEFVAFLSAFSIHASLQQKVECKGNFSYSISFFVQLYFLLLKYFLSVCHSFLLFSYL